MQNTQEAEATQQISSDNWMMKPKNFATLDGYDYRSWIIANEVAKRYHQMTALQKKEEEPVVLGAIFGINGYAVSRFELQDVTDILYYAGKLKLKAVSSQKLSFRLFLVNREDTDPEFAPEFDMFAGDKTVPSECPTMWQLAVEERLKREQRKRAAEATKRAVLEKADKAAKLQPLPENTELVL